MVEKLNMAKKSGVTHQRDGLREDLEKDTWAIRAWACKCSILVEQRVRKVASRLLQMTPQAPILGSKDTDDLRYITVVFKYRHFQIIIRLEPFLSRTYLTT